MNNHERELKRTSDDAAPANAGEEQEIATKARRAKSGQAAAVRKPGEAKSATRSSSAKPAGKSKKDQLIALLSKPNGARISVLVERLGWQAHTVRAALSGLRKQGLEIATSKSPKTGEAVYVIAIRNREGADSSDKASS